MFVKPIFAVTDPAGNGVSAELIAINSTLTLGSIRLIRNRAIPVVHRFHRREKVRGATTCSGIHACRGARSAGSLAS